jgi:hypothetical protein
MRSMTNKLIKGIIPVIPTPFTENEELDLEALERLVDVAARANAAPVCLPAYAREFYKLTDPERSAVLKTALKGASCGPCVQCFHPATQLSNHLDPINSANHISSISTPTRVYDTTVLARGSRDWDAHQSRSFRRSRYGRSSVRSDWHPSCCATAE